MKHSPGATSLEFDSSCVSRGYLRCALVQAFLWKKGVPSFKSRAAASFYEVLLRSPTDAAPKLKDKDYRRILKNHVQEYGAGVEAALSEFNYRPRCESTKRMSPPSPKHSSLGGRSRSPSPKRSRKATSSSSSSDESSSSSSNEVKSNGSFGADSGVEDGVPEPADGFPPKLFGEVLQRKKVKTRGVHPERIGLLVNCPNPLHRVGEGCETFRSSWLGVADVCKHAAVHYLGTWLLEAYSMPHAEHRTYRPTPADVRKHLETYGDNVDE